MKLLIIKIKIIIYQLLNYLFPNRCVLCIEDLNSNRYICQSCLDKLTPFRNFSQDFYSLYHFVSNIKRLLWLLKYDFRKEVGFTLGTMLGKDLKQFFDRDDIVLIPVPLHREKFYIRGYNQAEIIANGLGSVTGWRVEKDLISRLRFTESQTTFSKIKRKQNMMDAFSINFTPKDDIIYYIVDDVVTTGATTSQIKDLLIREGAKMVCVASIAAPNPPQKEII